MIFLSKPMQGKEKKKEENVRSRPIFAIWLYHAKLPSMPWKCQERKGIAREEKRTGSRNAKKMEGKDGMGKGSASLPQKRTKDFVLKQRHCLTKAVPFFEWTSAESACLSLWERWHGVSRDGEG